jgi:choice-of-anchor B domain-containing protein
MIRIFKVLFLAWLSLGVIAQKKSYNTTLLSNVKFNENASGMWGFTQDGIDYAVIGTLNTTKIYSLKNHSEPKLKYEISASNSIWREARYYGKHIYITNDRGNDGIVIVDMSDTTNIRHKNFKPQISLGTDIDKEINTCHAINMDENGLLSLTGCNVSRRGVLMFDVKTDPWNPKYLGATDLVYAHDTYNRGDTMYVSEITTGRLGIYNIVDKSNPVLINTQTTSKAFTHNAWMSDDKKYIFTTDEREGAWVDAYDITDHQNLILVDKYQISDALRSIPHNTYNNNGYLVTSWYTEGIRVIDVHRPENMIEIAGYDTWEDPIICHSGFHGCWGVYPYGQNNTVFGSDIENGLYVIRVDYKRACYFEGKIKLPDGSPLTGANVRIIADQLNGDITAGDGSFKTGLADAGIYKVVISHPDFSSIERTIELKNGEITYLDLIMQEDTPSTLAGTITNNNGNPINAKITFSNQVRTVPVVFDSNGTLTPNTIQPDNYNVDIDAWGYLPFHKENVKIQAGETYTLSHELTTGYGDNFETDLGWQIINTANTVGGWFRGVPKKTVFSDGSIANPDQDSDDPGKRCFVTGSVGISGASCDDLDSGESVLVSPKMDLTTMANPVLSYDAWFFNAGGNSAINDTLVISLYDGSTEVIIDKIYGRTNGWQAARNIKVNNFITPTANMELRISVEDKQGSGNIVEAGFDNFSIINGTSSVEDTNLSDLSLSPNPSQNFILIDLKDKMPLSSDIKGTILNTWGQNMGEIKLGFHTQIVEIDHLPAGVYTLQLQGFKPKMFVKF